MTDSIAQRLSKEPTPLIDGEQVTFVWRGKTAPRLEGDFTGWDDGKPVKLSKQGDGLWTYQLSFPSDAYIEYGFVKGENSLSDPLNPRQTTNGVGGFNNYFNMEKYKATKLARKGRHVPHGVVTEHHLDTDYLVLGDERTVYLYEPPVKQPVPLVVVWDGWEYYKRLRLNYIVDNLIDQGRMKPIALAMLSNGGEDSRTSEYACNDATLAFLMAEVLPLAYKELKLIEIREETGAFGVIGSSMGGLMALYTAARLPSVFGKVLSQSGAFTLGNLDTVVFDLLSKGGKLPLQIWLDVGKYDLPGLLETNRRMQSMLTQHSYTLSYREYSAGHNWPAWRDDIWRGLQTLFAAND